MSLPHVRIDNKGAAVRALAVTLAALTWLLVVGGPATALAIPPNTQFNPGDPPNPSPAPAVTHDSTPTFTFGSNRATATFECRLDGEDPAPYFGCSSPHTLTTPLTNGTHWFDVRAIDAGETDLSPSRRTFITEDGPPQTNMTGGPQAPATTTTHTPTFTFTSNEAGSTFQCRVDGVDTTAPYASCSSPYTTDTLPNGTHTLEVQAIDTDGNIDETPASRTFIIDDGPPQTTLAGGPPPSPATTGDTTPSFGFTSSEPDGATFQCRVDGVDGADPTPWVSCTSPYTTGLLANGDHKFEVRAIDIDGNIDPTAATRIFRVDDGPPQTTIDSGPAPGSTTTDNTPTLTFVSSEPVGATFECRVDAQAYAQCTSPHTTAVLSNGAHVFNARAIDTDGNVDETPASRSFTVNAVSSDTTAPVVTVTTPAANATYAIGQPVNAAYSCADPGGSGAPTCVGTVANGAAINTATLGAKTFTVTSTDAANNTTVKTVQYTVGKAATTLVATRASRGLLGLLSITFYATLTRNYDGAPLQGKSVAFRIGGNTMCSANTNSAGRASCTVGGLFLGSGTYTATYAGDGTYQPSSGSARF